MSLEALFMFILPYGLVYWGESHITSGLCAILFSTRSLFVVGFAHILLKSERAYRWKGLGLLLGLTGLLLIFHDQPQFTSCLGLAGMVAVLAAAASWGFALVWRKRRSGEGTLLMHLTAQSAIFRVVLALLTLWVEPSHGDWTPESCGAPLPT